MLASFKSQDTFSPQLSIIAGADDTVSRKVTLLSGQNLKRGALLGSVGVGGATSAAKTGGNTGGGTLTLDATTPVLVGAKSGVYTARAIAAATDSGTFRVVDPDGFILGDVVVGATFANDIKFVIADAGTDFIVGDGFDITVAAGSAKMVASLAAAADGSQLPSAILAEDCDASLGDKVTVAYVAGTFDEMTVTYGTGHTAATVKAAPSPALKGNPSIKLAPSIL